MPEGGWGSYTCCSLQIRRPSLVTVSRRDYSFHGLFPARGRAGTDKLNTPPAGDLPLDDDEPDGLDAATPSWLPHKRSRRKGQATISLIRQAIAQNPLCALLDESAVEAMVETMEYFTFSPGNTIAEQGKAGSTFLVTERGTMEVAVNEAVCSIIRRGDAFGGLALVCNHLWTATVTAVDEVGVWGIDAGVFRRILQAYRQKHHHDSCEFVNSFRIFDGVAGTQTRAVAELFFLAAFGANAQVLTQGHSVTAIYYVKKGELRALTGATVGANGQLVGGEEVGRFGPGDTFGATALISNTPQSFSVVTLGNCELLCASAVDLRKVLGADLQRCFQQSPVLQALQTASFCPQYSPAQQLAIAEALSVRECSPGEPLGGRMLCAVVADGFIFGLDGDGEVVTYSVGQCYDDGSLTGTTGGCGRSGSLRDLAAGPAGARLYVLDPSRLGVALKGLGLPAMGRVESAVDLSRKVALLRKVHIFSSLPPEEVNELALSLALRRYGQGARVVTQGEVGTAFFLISTGEVKVTVGSEVVRTMGRNAYFGERALLFDEPRTASVEVTSPQAGIWSIEKEAFVELVGHRMMAALMHRIRLQDITVAREDLRDIKIIGEGFGGVVSLVEHKASKVKYALKRVEKSSGQTLAIVQRECDILAQTDHPFILSLVKTFDAPEHVDILTELMTGGELFDAIRAIPTRLSRSDAQFYIGSLVLALEDLSERRIIYRDLKPENVMLDAQGYLKLIDFGAAKQLEQGTTRTYTSVGTPHYMAPEVMLPEGHGTSADLWSLGVVLFELVCGYLPFGNDIDETEQVCAAVLGQDLKFPSKYADQCGRTLMEGLLCRRPGLRLGAGAGGYEALKRASFFEADHAGDLFHRILRRDLDPPYVPHSETFSYRSRSGSGITSDRPCPTRGTMQRICRLCAKGFEKLYLSKDSRNKGGGVLPRGNAGPRVHGPEGAHGCRDPMLGA